MLMEHHPLSGVTISAGGGASLRIRLAEDCARFSLRVAGEGIAEAGKAFGCELPARIGGIAISGERLALCLGPDEWLLLAPLREANGVIARFGAFYGDVPHSLVDIGHRETSVKIEGPAAATALAAACPLDLAGMAAGTGTRTVFDKAQIILIKRNEESYWIEVWCSFAPHVCGLLEAASHEIELGI